MTFVAPGKASTSGEVTGRACWRSWAWASCAAKAAATSGVAGAIGRAPAISPGRTSTSISRLAKNPPTPPLLVSRRDTMTASSPSSWRMRGTSSSSERPR